MADYDEELSEIESEVDRLTRQVSGYKRFGQSTPLIYTRASIQVRLII
jgi:hypothetical protein